MATVTVITDDITGLQGAETRRFDILGNTYDIDLTDLGAVDAIDALNYVKALLAVARPVHPSLVETATPKPRLHPALQHTDPLYRARNAQIVERFHVVKSRKGMTKGRALDIVGEENGLSGQRIRQITDGLPHTAAVEYLLSNP